MDLDKIKAKLEALKQQSQQSGGGSSNSGLIWKPSVGKQVIRILPYIHTPDYPFIELLFYYDFGKTWLSPSVSGNADPVIEYCNGMIDSSKKLSKEEFATIMKLKRKLLPKDRVYVPILVRDQESEGVKFWGFAKTIHMELLSIIDDPDYGDITDPTKGRDVTIEYIPAAKEGEFAKTKILVKPNISPISTDSEVLEKIKAMPNLIKTFTEPTYNELNNALKTYLQSSPSEEPKQQPDKSVKAGETEGFDTKNFTPPSGPKEESKSKVDASDIEKMFEDAFPEKD